MCILDFPFLNSKTQRHQVLDGGVVSKSNVNFKKYAKLNVEKVLQYDALYQKKFYVEYIQLLQTYFYFKDLKYLHTKNYLISVFNKSRH